MRTLLKEILGNARDRSLSRAIFCCDANGGIGKEGTIPWHVPYDLKWFKEHTLGKPVIMGRKTAESDMPFPLPGRKNVVLTRASGFYPDADLTCDNLEDAVSYFRDRGEVSYLIGGASLYNQAIESKLLDVVYTRILDEVYDCDTFVDLVTLITNYKAFDLTGGTYMWIKRG